MNGGATVKSRDRDVLAFLQDDHEDLQSQYEGFQTAGGDDRFFLANRIIRELEVHNRIEEEVFYPAVERAVERQGHKKGAALVRAALREHRGLKDHLAKVKESRAYDDRLTAQIDALMERVQRHVETEERELFPVAQALLGTAGLMRLRQDAREWQEELQHRLAA
ncbi:hemerythrin domain-containing protein [Nitrospira moscoviensis]|uniref:Putative Hemerythrin HHE cation binding domain protein n=1 Tax=Nitrospira moscoviensis TaxID=42253 RepID=A0A0K2GE34_NITMO|nr:hemerythrin domain-containing protein [Nitrospira moscoviensis]ALA59208.1 putative Hemerythrin HHE cation binding domain protein [Nitrospira moscoviensis]